MTERLPDDLTIAVDIGSTNTHAGLVNAGKRYCLFRDEFLSAKTAARFPAFVDKVIAYAGKASDIRAVIAGGHNGTAEKAEKILKQKNIRGIIHLFWNDRLPLRLRYKPARTLGADRIADALYAITAHPKRNVIIIDSGTAITVDAIDRTGKFIGGAICAGIGTQLMGLHLSTHTLPDITVPLGKLPFPGNSTDRCMQAGAAYGTAGALNYLIKKYRTLLAGNVTVLATGSAWQVTSNLVDFNVTEVRDMTLLGTAMYQKFLQ